MFNQYLELTPEDADIAMINVVLENLKFIVISLDQIFGGCAGEDYYNEDYTFYFYHLQNTLTSWGAVINMLSSGLRRQKLYNERARHLREAFNIDPSTYKWLFNKNFRNAGEHADERYDLFSVNETRFSNSFIEKRVSSCLQSLEKSKLFLFAHLSVCASKLSKYETNTFMQCRYLNTAFL